MTGFFAKQPNENLWFYAKKKNRKRCQAFWYENISKQIIEWRNLVFVFRSDRFPQKNIFLEQNFFFLDNKHFKIYIQESGGIQLAKFQIILFYEW